MKKQKQIYVSPETETLVVRFEGAILYVSGGRNVASTDGGVSGDDEYEDDYGDL